MYQSKLYHKEVLREAGNDRDVHHKLARIQADYNMNVPLKARAVAFASLFGSYDILTPSDGSAFGDKKFARKSENLARHIKPVAYPGRRENEPVHTLEIKMTALANEYPSIYYDVARQIQNKDLHYYMSLKGHEPKKPTFLDSEQQPVLYTFHDTNVEEDMDLYVQLYAAVEEVKYFYNRPKSYMKTMPPFIETLFDSSKAMFEQLNLISNDAPGTDVALLIENIEFCKAGPHHAFSINQEALAGTELEWRVPFGVKSAQFKMYAHPVVSPEQEEQNEVINNILGSFNIVPRS